MVFLSIRNMSSPCMGTMQPAQQVGSEPSGREKFGEVCLAPPVSASVFNAVKKRN